MNSQSIKRFTFGAGMGIFIAMIVWSYSVYYHVSISLIQGLIGILFLAIPCGILASISDIDKLMDSFPPFL